MPSRWPLPLFYVSDISFFASEEKEYIVGLLDVYVRDREVHVVSFSSATHHMTDQPRRYSLLMLN
jgi:hypothetical protein